MKSSRKTKSSVSVTQRVLQYYLYLTHKKLFHHLLHLNLSVKASLSSKDSWKRTQVKRVWKFVASLVNPNRRINNQLLTLLLHNNQTLLSQLPRFPSRHLHKNKQISNQRLFTDSPNFDSPQKPSTLNSYLNHPWLHVLYSSTLLPRKNLYT